MPAIVAQKIINLTQGQDKPQVTILGVTYKPNVDDMRESPILTLISHLKTTNIQVIAQDPFAKGYQGDPYQAAAGSDLLVLGVDHNIYRDLDLKRLAQAMRTACLLYTSSTPFQFYRKLLPAFPQLKCFSLLPFFQKYAPALFSASSLL